MITNKDIAKCLRNVAGNYPDDIAPAGTESEMVLTITNPVTLKTFAVRCRPFKPAILSIADKYSKNKKFNSTGYNTSRKAFNMMRRESKATIIKRYCGDEDLDQFKLLFK